MSAGPVQLAKLRGGVIAGVEAKHGDVAALGADRLLAIRAVWKRRLSTGHRRRDVVGARSAALITTARAAATCSGAIAGHG